MAACDSSKAVFAPGWPRSFFAPKLTAEAFGEAFPPPARLQRDNQSRAGTDQCSQSTDQRGDGVDATPIDCLPQRPEVFHAPPPSQRDGVHDAFASVSLWCGRHLIASQKWQREGILSHPSLCNLIFVGV